MCIRDRPRVARRQGELSLRRDVLLLRDGRFHQIPGEPVRDGKGGRGEHDGSEHCRKAAKALPRSSSACCPCRDDRRRGSAARRPPTSTCSVSYTHLTLPTSDL